MDQLLAARCCFLYPDVGFVGLDRQLCRWQSKQVAGGLQGLSRPGIYAPCSQANSPLNHRLVRSCDGSPCSAAHAPPGPPWPVTTMWAMPLTTVIPLCLLSTHACSCVGARDSAGRVPTSAHLPTIYLRFGCAVAVAAVGAARHR